ncbi:hypothetical protein LPJ74_004964 [Coemansia sp. RSA 1843]|nr:hypothetical protein LPJ74_004964 [Coemansia sp. RSA 1843]
MNGQNNISLVPEYGSSSSESESESESKTQSKKKSKVDDTDGDDEHLNLQESGSFFTIGESEQAILQRELDANTNSTDVDPDSADHIIATKDQTGEIEMYYDPNSGYYYDHTSGLYYYYDPDSSQYIDARSLYQDQNDRHMTEVRSDVHARENPSLGSNIDKADIEKLIGRSAFKRGEASAMIGMAVKDLSHRSQLAGSDYSDAKSGAEFAAKRAAESRRRATHTIIEGDAVGKKKKQKHNIMYLALQAQEQESELKEAHANRKNARKAARSKYGM